MIINALIDKEQQMNTSLLTVKANVVKDSFYDVLHPYYSAGNNPHFWRMVVLHYGHLNREEYVNIFLLFSLLVAFGTLFSEIIARFGLSLPLLRERLFSPKPGLRIALI